MPSDLIQGGQPLGTGVGDATLAEAALVDMLAAYRRRVAGNYRALRQEEIDTLPNGPMHVSTKIDGELWFLVRWSGETFLANPRGAVIAGSFPVLAQAPTLGEQTVIAGELHARVDGRRARVGDLAAAMAGGVRARVDSICFSAFDFVCEGGEAVRTPYEERFARLGSLIPGSANLEVVTATVAKGAAEVRARFDSEVLSGTAEGLVVRLPNGLVYKLKPAIHIDAAVIGFTTRGDSPDQARSILLGLLHEDGRMQLLGSCGNIGSEEDRRALHQRLVPLVAPSTIRYASETGGLYTFVRPELVAEVRTTDLQAERSDGTIATGPVLEFGPDGWVGRGVGLCPRLIHPVLERLRTDKRVDVTDVRFAQVGSFLPAQASAPTSAASLPASTLIRRSVWTKETKGQVAVRKLLVWRTNKEQVDRSFPAYVVHWTDYSATRASPLDREVRLAPDEARALAIAEAMVAENIKKGWVAAP